MDSLPLPDLLWRGPVKNRFPLFQQPLHDGQRACNARAGFYARPPVRTTHDGVHLFTRIAKPGRGRCSALFVSKAWSVPTGSEALEGKDQRGLHN